MFIAAVYMVTYSSSIHITENSANFFQQLNGQANAIHP